jgi:hypothetical protein
MFLVPVPVFNISIARRRSGRNSSGRRVVVAFFVWYVFQVCNMENFDPLGIHTGDSIVVAPSQTLSNAVKHTYIICLKYIRPRLRPPQIVRVISPLINNKDWCLFEYRNTSTCVALPSRWSDTSAWSESATSSKSTTTTDTDTTETDTTGTTSISGMPSILSLHATALLRLTPVCLALLLLPPRLRYCYYHHTTTTILLPPYYGYYYHYTTTTYHHTTATTTYHQTMTTYQKDTVLLLPLLLPPTYRKYTTSTSTTVTNSTTVTA